jgi:hypothetical protein
VPGDIEAITPQHAPWRTREYSLLADGSIDAWCRAAGVALAGYRAVQDIWLARF